MYPTVGRFNLLGQATEGATVRFKVEMTLSAETAQRFHELAQRLASMDLGDDGTLAAAVLERIATGYDVEIIKAKMAQVESQPDPNGQLVRNGSPPVHQADRAAGKHG